MRGCDDKHPLTNFKKKEKDGINYVKSKQQFSSRKRKDCFQKL